MRDPKHLALEAVQRIEASPGFQQLAAGEQGRMRADLMRIQGALGEDPYDAALDTPADLRRSLSGGPQRGTDDAAARGGTGRATPPAAPAARRAATETIGARTAEALEAVDFGGFVSGLVGDTFQAIVDATAQQVREYADLVSSIARSVDDFSRDNVTPFQVRQSLSEKHGADLKLVLPKPGAKERAALEPAPGKEGTTPAWLVDYALGDEELTKELVDGRLVDIARSKIGEERLQSLATMVLMGINRIVISEGHIRAKLQFHATARDSTEAQIASLSSGRAAGIAGKQISLQSAARAQVSTVRANTQADAALKTNLMGEVHLVFSTETFALERFADSPAIQLIQQHARWTPEPAPQAPGAGPQAPAAPAAKPEGS